MQLNHQIFGENGQTLILVHGLFGSIANWRAVARELSQQYKVYVVDQRNHGDSPHADSMTYQDMSEDLDKFITTHNLEDFILCGHSMGGKAAMHYALSNYPSAQQMHSLIVLDIAPEVYTHSHEPYLAAMQEIDLSTIQSRSDADKLLHSAIPDAATRLFLMQSLERKNDQFRWRINVPILRSYMPDIVGFPNDLFNGSSNDIKTLFLNGSKSSYVSSEMHGRIKTYFPNAIVDSIDAGHWLHVELRDVMLLRIHEFLQD